MTATLGGFIPAASSPGDPAHGNHGIGRAPAPPVYTSRMGLRRVLIADDEESVRHVLTVLLQERGYGVRAVGDGEEALRELSTRDYDALVTDVRMPKMNGLDLVRAAQSASPETN